MRPQNRWLVVGSGTPIVVVPGWGTSPAAYQDFVSELAHTTWQPAAFIGTCRRGGSGLPMTGIPRSISRQAAHICSTMEELRLRQAVGIGHSAGGPMILAAALHQPARFKRIVLLCSAAVCSDNPFSLTWRLMQKAREDRAMGKRHPNPLVRRLSKAALRDGVRYAATNPLRALAEGWALGTFNAHKLVSQVRDAGVEVWFVGADKDTLFTPLMNDTAAVREIGGVHRLQMSSDILHDANRFPGLTTNFLAGANSAGRNLLQ